MTFSARLGASPNLRINMVHTILEAFVAAAAFSSFALAGWTFLEVAKVESLEENVRYIRARVDAIYDHFLDRS